MQSCIYKGIFSYSIIIKRISLRALYYHTNNDNNSRRNKVNRTLHVRFIKYLDNDIAMKMNKSSEIDSKYSITDEKRIRDSTVNQKLSRSNINVINNNQNFKTDKHISNIDISSILEQINNLHIVSGPIETQMQLDIIEEEILGVLDALSFEQILLLLNKLIVLVPQRLAGLNLYKKSTEKLRKMLSEGSNIEPTKIVNFLLISSLRKTLGARDVSFVLKYLPQMRNLSLIERSIVSMATFKSGIKLDRENIQTIEDTVEENLDRLIEDPGLFVSLLKALRFGGPSQEFNLNSISKRILEDEEKFEIPIAVPILALYAEMLKPEYKVVNKLVKDSVDDIIGERNSADFKSLNSIRTKDVNRLLWATSRLNHKMQKHQLKEIEVFIESRLNELSRNPKEFSGMLLSLWMLGGSESREQVEYCFKNKIFEPLLNASQDDQARLNLLIECVRIESPEMMIPAVLDRKLKPKSMKDCNELITVTELIKCLEPHLALYQTYIDCPIKSVRIYGITARHEKLGFIHMDMLNNVTCLKDTRKPNGLMSLKLRLIKALGYFSILLNNDGVINIESMIYTIEEKINAELNKLG